MLLYKYRPFNINTLKMIERTTVYYADPETFNDPLDCDPGIESCSSKTRLELVVKKLYEKPAYTEKSKYKMVLSNLRYEATNPEYGGSNAKERDKNYCFALLAEIKRRLKSYFKNTGVLCMAESHSSMLMWSHYAENHTGVCIGYKS